MANIKCAKITVFFRQSAKKEGFLSNFGEEIQPILNREGVYCQHKEDRSIFSWVELNGKAYKAYSPFNISQDETLISRKQYDAICQLLTVGIPLSEQQYKMKALFDNYFLRRKGKLSAYKIIKKVRCKKRYEYNVKLTKK